MSIQLSEVETLILGWVEAVYPEVTWVLSHQAHSRLARPYGTFTHLSEGNEATPELETTDTPSGDEYERIRRDFKAGTFRLSMYADDAQDRMEVVEGRLDHDDARAFEDSNDFSVREPIASSTPTRVFRNTEWEHFSTLDLAYSRIRTTTLAGPTIDSVSTDGTVNDA